jgi:hypothetical protein
MVNEDREMIFSKPIGFLFVLRYKVVAGRSNIFTLRIKAAEN